MPGQKNIFTPNSKSKPKEINENNMRQMNQIYKREKYINYTQNKGKNEMSNNLNNYTYNEFTPFSDESLLVAIGASYKQVYGNFAPMESERSIELERRLRNGDIPIREFVRGLAKSTFYLNNFVLKFSQKRLIELNFMHLLGRPLMNQQELIQRIDIITNEGFERHVDDLVDSFEYEKHFGEDIVPFQRFWNSPFGGRTSSFVKTASFRKGFASSDNVFYQ